MLSQNFAKNKYLKIGKIQESDKYIQYNIESDEIQMLFTCEKI